MDTRLLTVKEVAAMLGLGVSSVWRNVARGNLPKPIKVGSATRWRLRDIEKAIEAA